MRVNISARLIHSKNKAAVKLVVDAAGKGDAHIRSVGLLEGLAGDWHETRCLCDDHGLDVIVLVPQEEKRCGAHPSASPGASTCQTKRLKV